MQGTWKCKGAESGTPFDEVEFEDGTWNDYDEKAGEPVGISEIEVGFFLPSCHQVPHR